MYSLLSKINRLIICGFISRLSSVPLDYVSVLMPVPHCFDYSSFVIAFKIRKHDASSFVLLAQDCFGSSILCGSVYILQGFPGDSVVKNLPANQETQVQFLGRQDPLEKEMATHSSILAWKIPWTEERGRLLSVGLQD